MILTNKQLKLINSLHSKKGRRENKKFLVEGEKGIEELLDSNYRIDFIVLNDNLSINNINVPIYIVDSKTLNKLSTFENNSFGLAVVNQFENEIDINFENQPYSIILDGIRDPGNLGTIIRICDWYGITNLFASKDSAEFYNPKVISASMGSFKRIRFQEIDLEVLFEKYPSIPKLGAFLDGENIHEFKFPKNGFIILGNESQGIRENLKSFISKKITIPRFGNAESLNVGISTGIILDNLKRNN